MLLVYLVALHYYRSPRHTWLEKYGSSPGDVSLSAHIIEHCVTGPGGAGNPARWRKYVNNVIPLGLCYGRGIEGSEGKLVTFYLGSLGKTLG